MGERCVQLFVQFVRLVSKSKIISKQTVKGKVSEELSVEGS